MITKSNVLADLCAQRWEDQYIIDGTVDAEYTYGDFFAAALLCSQELQRRGLKPQSTICVVAHNGYSTLVFYIGALLAGIRIALIDPEKGDRGIRETLNQVKADLVLVDEGIEVLGMTHESIRSFIVPDGKRPSRQVTMEALASIDMAREFLITFTSGSTGTPKGVIHSFGSLIESARAFSKEFDFDKRHTFYHHLPMTYMAGVLNSFVLPLVVGSKIVLGHRFAIGRVHNFWDIPLRYGVNVYWFIPTIISVLEKVDRDTEALSKIRSSGAIGCVGTAPLSLRARQRFEEKYNVQLYESYGLSETLFVATQSPQRKSRAGSPGYLLDGAQVQLAEDGEIAISVPWMFRGYLLAKKTELFSNKSFVSGDLGLIEDRILSITGRKKDIIIRGGMNVSPRPLEEFLAEQDVFDAAVILGVPDEVLGEKIVCFFVPHDNWQLAQLRHVRADIITALGQQYAVDEFVHVERMPTLVNGKIDKISLRAMYPSV